MGLHSLGCQETPAQRPLLPGAVLGPGGGAPPAGGGGPGQQVSGRPGARGSRALPLASSGPHRASGDALGVSGVGPTEHERTASWEQSPAHAQTQTMSTVRTGGGQVNRVEGVHGGKGRSWSCRRRAPGLQGRGTPLGDGPLDVIGSVRPLDLALDFGRTPPGLAASPRLCSERPQGSLQAQHRDSGQKSKPARGGGTQSHGRKGVSRYNRGHWAPTRRSPQSLELHARSSGV